MRVAKAFKLFRETFASAIHHGSTTAAAKKAGLDAVKQKFGSVDWAGLLKLLMPLIEAFITAWLGK